MQMPNDWWPRDYELPFLRAMDEGCLRACLVWHRRAGKDSTALNFLAKCAAQTTGVYWHIGPTKTQARKFIWNNIDSEGRKVIDQAVPMELRKSTNNVDMMIELLNGSIINVLGSEADSLVGPNPIGVNFSEYSVSRPGAWDYIRPILAENGGWATFEYTPRGRNHGKVLYDMAKNNPSWFCSLLTVEDTGRISLEAIEEERKAGMSDEMIEQEFYCSFQGVLEGSVYGKQMHAAEKDGRIRSVPYEKDHSVHTLWDLGFGDDTAIWFFQVIGREVHIIDFYANNRATFDHYAKVLKDRDYIYGDHIFPHDAKASELGSGSRVETLANLGIKATVLPRPRNKLAIEDQIEAVRHILDRCWFDQEETEEGRNSLEAYHFEWSEKMGRFSAVPVHDWSSHASDSFRLLPEALEKVGAVVETESITFESEWG